ncbi:TPA: hypothetical protein H7C24_003469, partial [Escherichia coli]|nr:hypothetical protein [Escherichia coli]
NADINTRLEQSARIIQRTPDEVLPALVLAATWFDNAARDADIIRRNAITHPGFVPVIPLKVSGVIHASYRHENRAEG